MTTHPERVGSYRILDVLGRGGMGVVYRARHEDDGREVALKMVSTFEPVRLEGLRREIHALARLSHPGIVRIVEEGLYLGEPWYAMERVEGATLDRYAAVEGREQALAAVARICDALSYLHGEGLVHRDLKPANVLIRPGGQPVLVDFGVAVDTRAESSRESLPGDVTSVGSYLYVAPEHLRGEAVDARADLYSLGCILCELLTGSPPFASGSPREVLRDHLETPFVLPGSVAVSARLRWLLERLLAKRPTARPGFADEVAACLRAPGDPVAPHVRSYVYRPTLAGREELFIEAAPSIDALRVGRGGILIFRGPSGIGKTRLARELTERAERRGALVIAGRGVAAPRGALSALRGPLAAVAARCRERGARELTWLVGPRLPILAPYSPEIRALLPEVAEPARLPADEAILRLYLALTETLEALATSLPVLLLIDDLQWADDLTLGWLAHMARRRPETRPLLVLGTLRTDEPSSAEMLQEIPGARTIDVGGLDRHAMSELVGGMLATDAPPPHLVDLVTATSAGSPFFATEQVRAAVEAGTLARRGGTWQLAAGELPLPRSLAELLERRLATLPSLEVARAAAVLGAAPPAGLLGEVAGLDAGALWEQQSELLRLAILVEDRAGSVVFRHDRLREAVLAGMEGPAAARLHERAAAAYERRPELVESFGGAARLARHWERAGSAERARPWFLKAARRAAASHAHDAAIELSRAYLELEPPEGAERIDARASLAKSLSVRGKSAEARREYEATLDEARRLADGTTTGRTLLAAAGHLHDVADWTPARLLLQEAAAAFREAEDPAGEALAIASRAFLDQEEGRTEEAKAACDDALRIARRSGDPGAEASVLGRMAVLHDQRGDPDRARPLYTEALRANRERGDRMDEAMTLSNLGNLHRKQGAMEEAMACYEGALAINRDIRYVRGEGTVLGNMALVHTQQGRVDDALDCHLRAIELDRQTGSLRGEAISLGNVGCLYKDMGRVDEGRVALEQALAMARKLGSRPLEGQLLGNLGILSFETGDAAAADRYYTEAVAIHRAVGNRRSEGITLGNIAQLRLRQRRLEEARAASEASLRIHRELGSRPFEGHTLGICADVVRLSGGDPAEALALIDEGEAILEAVGEKRDRAKLLCRKGHALLAAGRSARETLEEVKEIARLVKAGGASDLAQALGRLERAQVWFDAGGTLVRGECAPDLDPPGGNAGGW